MAVAKKEKNMKKYKFKLNKSVVILVAGLCALAMTGFAFAVVNLVYAELAFEYFSAITLMCALLFFTGTALSFLFTSCYVFEEMHLVIRTSFFREKLIYEHIRSLLYHASENELFLGVERLNDNRLMRVQIDASRLQDFIDDVKTHAPHAAYDISLKTNTDE